MFHARELVMGLALLLASQLSSFGASSEIPKVKHFPEQPRSGEAVRIVVKATGLAAQGEIHLQYQLVNPGKYLALKDPAFQTNWSSVLMHDDGQNGDETKGDGSFSVELPGSLQIHRRLVRYRISTHPPGKILAPDQSDTQSNFVYFAYDGVPSWRAAINPRSNDPKLREVITYDTNDEGLSAKARPMGGQQSSLDRRPSAVA